MYIYILYIYIYIYMTWTIYTEIPDYQTHTIFRPVCLNGHNNGHLYLPPHTSYLW